MSKKMSKINQSRRKLKELRLAILANDLGRIKRPKFSNTLKVCSSVVLALILLSYAATIYHFFA